MREFLYVCVRETYAEILIKRWERIGERKNERE